jgi:hypothetical protein
MNRSTCLTAAGLVLGAALGCEAPALPSAQETAPAAAPESAPPAEERPMVAGAPGEETPEDETPVTDVPRKFTAHDPVQGRRSRRAAEGGYSLGVGTTAAAGFYAKFQSMILAIDHANQIYWGRNNLEYAKTQEEFMKEVVKLALNGVPLPDLPEDEEYCYVPSQPEAGLQIRLKPGSPRSKVPAGTSAEDAIKMLGGGEQPGAPAEAPATDAQPAEVQPTEGQPAEAPAAANEPESGRDAAGNPLDLRERAASFGGQAPDVADPQQ